MARTWKRLTTTVALALVAIAPALAAQTPTATLVGLVRDSAGRPISGVEVWVRGSDLYALTNDAGGFRLGSVPPGGVKVSIRRLGYEPAVVELQLRSGRIDSLVIALTTMAASLPGVQVEEEAMTRSKRLLAGFWERRSRGFGHYFTREEIEKKEPHDFTDIVRTTAGVSIVYANGRKTIRFSRSPGIRGECPPQYWVDGMRLEGATPDEFRPGDVEAVEMYSGISTIPPQFAPRTMNVRNQTCGAIVIWTRLPGT